MKYYASQYISDLQHNVGNRYQDCVGPKPAHNSKRENKNPESILYQHLDVSPPSQLCRNRLR